MQLYWKPFLTSKESLLMLLWLVSYALSNFEPLGGGCPQFFELTKDCYNQLSSLIISNYFALQFG